MNHALPCSTYCLPKDHEKDGDLKGRPIHAAADTPATSLSIYLAKALQPLLKHVPAHLRNTEEFIEFISNTESVHGFCSLNVCNLYGSIPLEDLNDDTPSVFFSKHKSYCELRDLSNHDFEQLIRLSLTSDNVLIGSKAYKQRSGLAMGNNLAPILAIIHMNELDDQILAKSNGCTTLKRYMDDYFAFLISKEFTAERGLLETANSLNNAIRQLPFFDTLVMFNPQENTFLKYIPAGKATSKQRRNDVRGCRRIDVEKWLKTQTESTLRNRRRFNVWKSYMFDVNGMFRLY